MTIIGFTSAVEAHEEVAPSTSRVDGKHVPYGAVAFFVGECTVTCPECTPEEGRESGNIIFGDVEWDYPGYTCEECGRWIRGTLLVYENGPGSELDEDQYEAR